MKNKKTDRRTLYTISVIKDAFLKLLEEMSFDRLNVTKICNRAEISRATFYLYYENINEVLDDIIDDALLFSENSTGNVLDLIDVIQSGNIDVLKNNESVLPACQRIADSEKYHCLFMDAALSDYIIMKIANHEKNSVIPEIMMKTKLNEEEAEMLFHFMLYGSFYVNRFLEWKKNDKWYRFQNIISRFVSSGLKSV